MGKLGVRGRFTVRVVRWAGWWLGTFWQFTRTTRIVWIVLLPPWAIKVTMKG